MTYVYSELTDVPLTPNHLIYGRTLESVVARREQPEELTQANADRHSKYVRDLLKHFWTRWRNEYLTELREYHKQIVPRKSELISEDDVVLIIDEKQPRITWRVGRVVELLQGANDVIRGAKILCHTEQGRLSTIRRPVNKLVPLELSKDTNVDTNLRLTFVDEMHVQIF